MSNWTAFFAKFTGTYNTITQQLKDDTNITDVDYFHQLRTLVENDTLKGKLGALTSTSTGFLQEWSLFLFNEKNGVSAGTPTDEPAYSDGKWVEFETKFIASFIPTIQGFRADIEHSYFPTWSSYVDDFNADYQSLINQLQSDSQLPYSSLNSFLIDSQANIDSNIAQLNSESAFINELATLLVSKKAGLTTESTWTDFKNAFAEEWQGMIEMLQLDFTGVSWTTFFNKTLSDHKSDLVTLGDQTFTEIAQVLINYRSSDWEKFNALSQTDIRDKLSALDSNSAFFTEYTKVLASEMDDLINLFDKMVDEFDENDRTVVADLVEYIQSPTGVNISEFETYSNKTEAEVSGYLKDFFDDVSGGGFVSHIASEIQSKADDAFSGCTNTKERIQKFYESLTSGLLQGFTSFFDTMLENTTVTSYEDLQSSVTTQASIEADLKALACSHPFLHGQARFIKSLTDFMIPNYTLSFSFHGKLMDTESTPAPIADLTIELTDTSTDEVLSTTNSDDEGRFFLNYEILHDKQLLPTTQTFDLVVKDKDATTLHTESDVTATVGSSSSTTVSIARPAIAEPISSTINDVFIDHPSITLPSALDTYLQGEGYTTLFHIRSIGGLKNHDFTGASPAVDDTNADVIAAIALIDQHAELDTINSTEIPLNQDLIDAGYTSIRAISKPALSTFKTDTNSFLSDDEAASIHNAARQLQTLNESIAASLIIGDQYEPPLNSGASGNIWNEDWDEIKRKLDVEYEAQSLVDDRESAVSPLAYLYDLIEYITTNMEDGGSSIDISFLETNLYQRFSDLAGSINSLDTGINATRAMVEILRKYLVDNSISITDSDIGEYLKLAYIHVLSQTGITYGGLSKAIKGTAEEQAAFAENNSIEATIFNDLYFDLSASTFLLTEELLAENFGITDSTQPPLSTGTKITATDANDVIEEWHFDNISHELNTSSDGYIHLEISKTSTPDIYTVKAFRNSGSVVADQIAEGSLETIQSSGIVYLKPLNNSRLSGYVKFNYQGATVSDIKISAIPKLLASKLSVQKANWKANDDQVVLIDPDLVSPSDFVHANDLSSGVGELWSDRRTDLNNQLNILSSQRDDNDNVEAIGLPPSAGTIESVAFMDETIFATDSAGDTWIYYNGTWEANEIVTAGGTGMVNTDNDHNLYLPAGSDASIAQYAASGSNSEILGPVKTISYKDADSVADAYKFKDIAWKANGNMVIGAVAGSGPDNDVLIELTPAKASKYKGGYVTWDSSGNAYVFNASGPSIVKMAPSGEIVTSYGYKTDNPERYYKLETTSLYDEVLEANNGSTSSGTSAAAVTGKFDDGLELNGIDGFLKPNNLVAANTGAFSISFWIKPHRILGDHAQVLFSTSDSARNMGISLYLENSNLYGTHWYYDTVSETYVQEPITVAIESPLVAGAWHHIALSVDGSSNSTGSNEGIKLYIDGNLSGSLPSTLLDADQEIYLGGLDTSVQVKSHHYDTDKQEYVTLSAENGCKAVFDELKIFHRILTPGDVQGLYDSTTDGALVGPKDIALGSQGEVYVLDADDTSVKIFANDGSYISEIAFQNVDPSDDFLSIALDSSGNIYVADLIGKGPSGNGQVRVYNSDGVEQVSISEYNSMAFLHIYAVHVDVNDRLFIAQYDTATSNPLSKICVLDVSPDTPVELTEITQDIDGNVIRRPTAIGSDTAGNIYIADTNDDRIIKFDQELTQVVEWGGSDNFMFDAISSIQSYGSISISSSNEVFFGNGAVLSGDFTLYQTRMPEKTLFSGGNLRSLVCNSQDEIFMSRGNEISRYNPKDQSISSLNGDVDNPKQLAIDSFGRIYVADYGNNRIQLIDRNGSFIRNLDAFEVGNYNFDSSGAVAISSYMEVVAMGKETTTAKLLRFDLNKGLASVLKENGFVELSAQNVADLEAMEADGQDITTDLESYGLHLTAFRYLSSVLKSIIDLDEEAWENVFNISLQAYKNKKAADWILDEVTAGVYGTSSQLLVHPESKYEAPRSFTPWRASYLDRLEWEERLKTRQKNQEALVQKHEGHISETETQSLSTLRSLLIDLSQADGSTTEAKTETLSNALLLDLENESNNATTRVAVAIETLQSLVWRLRTGQLTNNLADLGIISDEFDAEWKWRSSYRTWKAAQFVNLFPENLLLPEIKPNQTNTFQKLVETLNNNPYITPEDACSLSNDYANYLKEISNFDQVMGTYSMMYPGMQDPCGHYNPTGTAEQMDDEGAITTDSDPIPVIYFFGLYKGSGKVYYAIYQYEDEESQSTVSDMSFIISDWKEVPGIEQVSELAACISYPKQPRGSSPVPVQNINLYYSREENNSNKPAYVSLDAKTNNWDKKKDIKLPTELSDKDVTLLVGDGIYNETKLVLSERKSISEYYSNFINGISGSTTNTEWKKAGLTNVYDNGPRLVKRDHYIEYDKVTDEIVDQYYMHVGLPPRTGNTGTYLEHQGIKEVLTYFGDALPLKYQCLAASGDVVVLRDSDRDRFYLTYYDFINQTNIGTRKSKLFNIALPNIGTLQFESISRWQDSDTTYLLTFKNDSNVSHYNLVQLSANWSSGFISGTIKKQGVLSGNEIISTIFSPESKGDTLFQHSNSNYEYGATILTKSGYGSMTLSKIQGVLNSNNEVTSVSVGAKIREITPRGQETREMIINQSTSSGIDPITGKPIGRSKTVTQLTSQRHFYLSLRPIGESSLKRKEYLDQIRTNISSTYRNNIANYFEEAYYYLPMLMADKLQRNGYFTEALDWYRLVYDYAEDQGNAKVFPLLAKEEFHSNTYANIDAFATDVENPHNIARTRKNAFTRYTLAAIGRCLIEYADEAFGKDTSESLAKAHSLYEKALDVLAEAGFNQTFTDCELAIDNIDDSKTLNSGFAPWLTYWSRLKQRMALVKRMNDLNTLINGTDSEDGIVDHLGTMNTSDPQSIASSLAAIEAGIEEVIASQGEVLDYDSKTAFRIYRIGIFPGLTIKINVPDTLKINYNFGIPRNPVKDYLAMYAEINLFKMRNGMNISGMARSLDAYATSTDSTTGMRFIGIGGQIINSGATYGPAKTQYHYKVLIERAKELTQLAGQMEASMLNNLEKYDAEQYSLQRAEQDLALTDESINLQDLRLAQADLGVGLAKQQLERTNVSLDQMDEWLGTNFENYYGELSSLYLSLRKAQDWLTASQTTAQVSSFMAQGLPILYGVAPQTALFIVAAAASASAGLAQSSSNAVNYSIQIASLKLSHKQRREDWTYQRNLAQVDQDIANTQISIATSQTRVVAQEKRMAELQRNFAETTVDFLESKFTNAELYRWMSQVMEGVYAYFLKQASNMAQQAARQLAFERQEHVPVNLQEDYWRISKSGFSQFNEGESPDRKGLTGSARLLQDIYKLDQHAFATDQRRLELNKTLSIATLFPFEFQQFKETGVLSFSTYSELFDRDFPGHYLRLIKQVKAQVIALVPPTQGIKATLVNNGISSTVVGGKGVPFNELKVVKQPETIALTGSNASNGLFELVSVYQQGKLLPFEGLGVDTNWELRMPKASNFFDYSSIADIIFTMDYSAKEDFIYAEEVKERLGTDVNTVRALSFKNNLPDQWYDLLHPDESATPMSVSFELSENDFPANVNELEIEDVMVHLASNDGDAQTFSLKTTLGLQIQELPNGTKKVMGTTTTKGNNSFNTSGIVQFSDLTGLSPVGSWTLEFPSDGDATDNRERAAGLFEDGSIDDVLIIITYKAQTAAW